jgi:hypothetical protein
MQPAGPSTSVEHGIGRTTYVVNEFGACWALVTRDIWDFNLETFRRRQVHLVRGAHPPVPDPAGAGGAGGDATSWVSAVASCRGSDLVVGRPSAQGTQHQALQREARLVWAAGTCGGTRLQLVASRGQSGVRGVSSLMGVKLSWWGAGVGRGRRRGAAVGGAGGATRRGAHPGAARRPARPRLRQRAAGVN